MAPPMAPIRALVAERITLLMNALTMNSFPRPARFVRLKLVSSKKAPTTTISVGSMRKSATYAKNGTAPIHETGRRRPPPTGRPTR
jgi:hypothetical protein